MSNGKIAKFRILCKTIIQNYFKHRINRSAAALAYYLLFAFFPLLIFITNLLGVLDLDIHNITWVLQQILPADTIEIVKNFLDYIVNVSNRTLMWIALTMTIWFTTLASQGLMDAVRQAHNLERPARPVMYTIKQILFTVILLFVIALTLILSFVGENVIIFIINLIPNHIFHITEDHINLWHYLRFVPIALLMFLGIGTLYGISLDHKPKVKSLLPGTFFSLILWLMLSMGFSFYVENFGNYSFVYGALGAVIVLLVWLYMSAIILILGAELNSTLQTVYGNNKLSADKAETTDRKTPSK
ncbi:MAG: YihY/virulence factor BrkB family protein [Ruminococcus sp.]|nr:YihY/virulence factor BrkB family protein [Ruminococcus sp.]